MRWQALFADLEAQLEAEADLQARAELADRVRRDLASVALADRLRAAAGTRVSLLLGEDLRVAGAVADAAPEWVLLAEDGGGSCLVPATRVLAVSGLGRAVAPPAGAVAARLGLRWALRALARDRAAVRCHLHGGLVLAGTLDRVGADHVDLATHPGDALRRAGEVRGVLAVPTAALVAVRSDGGR